LILEDEQRNGLIQIEPHDSDTLFLSYETHNFSWSGELTPEVFRDQFAAARTCGDIAQLPMLRSHGLAQGSTTGNTIALQDGKFFNTPRFPDEPQRHKVLDLIGDFYMLGAPLTARVTARNTGHSFNRGVIVRRKSFSV
jgi:UDP-3-O-acyl-N-acetylglucosamine deacetylase